MVAVEAREKGMQMVDAEGETAADDMTDKMSAVSIKG